MKNILEKYGILSDEEELLDKTLTTNEGNYKIKVSDIFDGIINNNIKEPETIKIANAPDVTGFNKNNTYYVTWEEIKDENENIISYEIPDDLNNLNGAAPDTWYDYTAGTNHYANVKTTGGENDCYWVWIPRYAYKISSANYHKSTAGTIDIVFLDGTGSTTNDILDKSKKTEIETAGGFKNESGADNWVIHPAFTNAGNGGFGELEGIWVAKFEASSNSKSIKEYPTADDLRIDGGPCDQDKKSDGTTQAVDTDLKVRVKPNVTSWRGITVNDIFTVCQNLTTSGNSLENTNKLDAHMMKNTEWGACAYLSRSKYGKNGEVWNNPYYNNETNYSPITGLCTNEAHGDDVDTQNLARTCKYNDNMGINASTTGNVYGIYDMAGGAWEYVAGYLSEINANSSSPYKNLADANDKYKDKYLGSSSSESPNASLNTGKYGDAIYETSSDSSGGHSSWEANYSCYINSDNPIFRRGGNASNGGYGGIFAYDAQKGEALTNHSFRPVVIRSK